MNKAIIPFKGELEIWYASKKSFIIDFALIFITLWVVLFPEGNIVYKLFPSLPKFPDLNQNGI